MSTLQIVLALLAGGVGLPIPEDLVILAAGWRVSRGDVTFWQLAPLVLASIVVSDVTLYALGRLARSHPRIARWLERPTVARFAAAYRRRGVKLVLLARIAMGARAPFFLAAGMARMPLARFILVDALGASVMTALWMRVGAWLGPRLHELEPHLHMIACGAVVGVLALLAWKTRRLWSTTSEPLPRTSSPRARRRGSGAAAHPAARPPGSCDPDRMTSRT